MLKLLFLWTAIICCGLSSFGQAKENSITIKSQFGGQQYYQNGKKINMSTMARIMDSNEQAYQQIKSAQSNRAVATILGFAGGFMAGWTLGAAIAGGNANWAVAGVGAGLIVASIPFNSKSNRQAASAVDIYNGGLTTSLHTKMKMGLAFRGNAVGVNLSF
jgi:hypothetical protein